MNVVSFAIEIMRMKQELEELRSEVDRLREIEKEYNQFFQETIRSNQKTMDNFVSLLVSPELYNLVSKGDVNANQN